MFLVKVVLAAVFLLALGGAAAGLMYAVTRAVYDDPAAELRSALKATAVTVDPATRAALDRHFERRGRWRAVGAAIGFGIVLIVSLPLDSGDAAGVTALGGALTGMQFAVAASALTATRLAPGGVRLASLQPHCLDEYLPRRQIRGQVLLALLGVIAMVTGGVVLVAVDWSSATGRTMLALGLVGALIPGAALLMERRLLSIPVQATAESDLIAHDLVLATALNDVVAASAMPLLYGGWVGLLLIGEPWWIAILWFAVAALPLKLLVGPRGPRAAPVAHRLAGGFRR